MALVCSEADQSDPSPGNPPDSDLWKDGGVTNFRFLWQIMTHECGVMRCDSVAGVSDCQHEIAKQHGGPQIEWFFMLTKIL